MNYRQYAEFCRQADLNPRAYLLRPIMGTYDMHKAYGYTDFDIVFLNDCYAMPYYHHIWNELHYRMQFPEWHGSVYHIDT